MLDHWLAKKLNDRKSDNSFRSLTLPSEKSIDFTSNDYLGLSHSTELFQLIHHRLDELSMRFNGATGSRLLSGNSQQLQDVELFLSKIFKSECSLIFNSGYSANLGVLSSLPQRGDTILYDELVHACIKDGARLSLASRFPFGHNDLNDLESKLKKAKGNIFIAVESIYSMDGDRCPLIDLVNLAERYNAFIILDEAHSTGVMGKSGSGLAVSLGVQHKIGARIYTFGKAMGIHGACVAGSSRLIEYLVNFSRPFIYTTALPPHSVASIECAFQYLDQHQHLQDVLQDRVKLFLSLTSGLTNRISSSSAIQTAIFPGNENARNASRTLQQKGFDIRPILSPTVPADKERLRICIHTYNTSDEIRALAESLQSIPV